MIRSVLSACYKMKERLRLKLNIFIYSRHLNRILPVISKHRPVRVMFYVNNLSMWKNDRLLMLLKNDDRFEPFIVSYLYPSDNADHRKALEQQLFCHFNTMDIAIKSGFDFKNNRLYPVSRFKADILFYPQPYRNRLKDIPRNVLLSYIPYCFEMEDERHFYNKLYQNICWKIFVPTELHRQLKARYNYNGGSNVTVSGNPLADYFFDGHKPSYKDWPSDDPKLKRIIWAPHHSILPDDILDYSNFLEIADEMLKTAHKFKDKAQFVFKPHPMLKEKLYKTGSWGMDRTDHYYEAWKSLPNGNLADGNYVDLFMTSDAMIHDCSSFTAEYLYVNKPVMFLTRKEKIEVFNDFADACFKVHYHGCSISDIESFIDNVINETDPMADTRTRFIKEHLRPKGNESVAGTIYKELCKLFE